MAGPAPALAAPPSTAPSLTAPVLGAPSQETPLTSIVRFLLTIGVIAGLVYGGMVALALFVQPEQRDITVTLPPGRIGK